MRASIGLILFAALGTSSVGCGATVEVPRICFTEPGMTVVGSPAGGSVTSPSFRVNVTNQIPLLRTNTSDTDLRVQDVTITPVGSSPDLSGIQTAKVQVEPPPPGAAVDVVQYQRDPAAAPPTAIVLDGDTVNIAPYLDNGTVSLSFTLSGQPPRTTWTADVKTCLRGQTSVSP